MAKRIPCAGATIMLRFLPYSGREPYTSKHAYGRYEECFASRQDARDRFRELRQERRIEDAEIVQEVGRGSNRTVMEWRDRTPRKRHKRRR